MGRRARSSRQANEAEIVGDVQCSSYSELSTGQIIGSKSRRFRSDHRQLGSNAHTAQKAVSARLPLLVQHCSSSTRRLKHKRCSNEGNVGANLVPRLFHLTYVSRQSGTEKISRATIATAPTMRSIQVAPAFCGRLRPAGRSSGN